MPNNSLNLRLEPQAGTAQASAHGDYRRGNTWSTEFAAANRTLVDVSEGSKPITGDLPPYIDALVILRLSSSVL